MFTRRYTGSRLRRTHLDGSMRARTMFGKSELAARLARIQKSLSGSEVTLSSKLNQGRRSSSRQLGVYNEPLHRWSGSRDRKRSQRPAEMSRSDEAVLILSCRLTFVTRAYPCARESAFPRRHGAFGNSNQAETVRPGPLDFGI